MLGLILAGFSALSSSAQAAPTAATCERSWLMSRVDAYVQAQEAGKPEYMLPRDAAPFNYTENFKAANQSTGILATPLRIDHSRSTLDTTQCASWTELIVTDPANPHVIGTQMRFDVGALTLTKMETIVTAAGDWLFNTTGTLYYASLESWDPIPEAQRTSRAAIQAAADAYLDLFNNKSVKVPWGNPCARLEGGIYVEPDCNVGVPEGIRQTNRRYVIDENVGSVDVMFSFADADPDSHEFRVENGTIRYVHTMTVMRKG